MPAWTQLPHSMALRLQSWAMYAQSSLTSYPKQVPCKHFLMRTATFKLGVRCLRRHKEGADITPLCPQPEKISIPVQAHVGEDDAFEVRSFPLAPGCARDRQLTRDK